MAIPNRWAVREAAEATFYDISNGDVVVALKTLKMTEVTTTGETTYAVGGRGNAKLIGFSGNREAKVTIQDAIFDNRALAMLMGNKLRTQGLRNKTITEEVVVESDGEIPMSDTSISTEVSYSLNGEVKSGTPASGVITDAEAKEGDRATITWQKQVNAQSFMVTAKDFAGTYKLVLDVVVRDLETGEDFYGQFIAPKVQIENDFTFSFAPDGDPSVMDIPIEIMKDTNSSLMYELLLFDNE